MRRVLAAVAVFGSLVAALALQGANAAPRTPEDPAEQLVLRLHDLPLGYFLLDFSEGAERPFECEDLQPEGPGPRMKSFIRRFAPRGCLGYYMRWYRIPGTASAAFVGTGAMDTGSAPAAEEGLGLAAALLSKLTGERLEEAPPAQTIGDATRLFHWRNVPTYFRNPHLGSFLVWRSGDVLAAVFASAGSLTTSDRVATDLAQRQQAHIENPTPYTKAERNNSELGLDDPALTLPVYWLGRTFRPGHGLPVARLREGGRARYFGVGLTAAKLELRYSKGLSLSSWTKRGWRRFLASSDGRETFAERCLKSTDLAIAGGRATIYTGHVGGFRPCAAGSPRRFFAVVHLGGIVVGVRLSSCRDCVEPARRSYNSMAAMKAAVRALQLRTAPEY